jgi:hypothetical protein
MINAKVKDLINPNVRLKGINSVTNPCENCCSLIIPLKVPASYPPQTDKNIEIVIKKGMTIKAATIFGKIR